MDNQIFSQLILNIAEILGLIFSYFIIVFLKKKIGIENLKKIETELQTNQELAKLAILYVQKNFKNVDNETKFNEAYIALSEMLERKGITLNETEIKVLIEGVLKVLKKQFGDAWKEEVK
jgi:LL-H family phage holin